MKDKNIHKLIKIHKIIRNEDQCKGEIKNLGYTFLGKGVYSLVVKDDKQAVKISYKRQDGFNIYAQWCMENKSNTNFDCLVTIYKVQERFIYITLLASFIICLSIKK